MHSNGVNGVNGHARSAKGAAVVVGGSSGIGLATVERFVKAGHPVIIGDIAVETGTKAAKGLQAKGADVHFIAINITDDASISAFLSEAVETVGRIHFACLTAGITGPTVEAHTINDKEWHQIMAIDLEGAWRFSKAMVTYFRAQEPRILRDDSAENSIWQPVQQRGSLVMVASSLGSLGKQYLAAYCAAKHGVIGLMRALALENAPYGIRINTISPGLTMTPLLRGPGYDFNKTKEYLVDQPMRRFAHPAEIASGIYFTASDGASFMTGSDWGPDGGSHIA